MSKIEIQNLNCEELIEAIKKDRSDVALMTKEIERIKNQESKKIDKNIDLELNTNSKSNTHISKENNNNEDFEEEVSYYFKNIDKVEETDALFDLIKQELPNKKSTNYKKLLLRLKMELLKNIKQIKELIYEDTSFSIEELKELRNDIKLNQEKINIISKIEEDKSVENSENETNNHLIFVTTTSGNIRIFEDIKKIDAEFFSRILELLLSIKDGTMKNPKNFVNNNKLSGISEVRNYQVRVIYDKISSDCYAVITTFVKKTDNDKSYRELLYIRAKNYFSQKENIKEMINNAEFLQDNREIENKIFNFLRKTDEKGTEKIYVK